MSGQHLKPVPPPPDDEYYWRRLMNHLYGCGEDRLNTLRWQLGDVQEETRNTRGSWKQLFGRYGELAQGPNLRGMARFLLTGR